MILRFLGLPCFALLAVAPMPGWAAQGCTVGDEAAAASIDRRSPVVARVISSRRVSGPVHEEVVKLKNGQTLTLAVGGCDHFGVRLKVGPVAGLTRGVAPEVLVRIARDLVRDLPVQASAGLWRDDIRSGLDAQARALDVNPIEDGMAFACGEYKTCELLVPQPGVLELGYLFAL